MQRELHKGLTAQKWIIPTLKAIGMQRHRSGELLQYMTKLEGTAPDRRARHSERHGRCFRSDGRDLRQKGHALMTGSGRVESQEWWQICDEIDRRQINCQY